MPEFVDPPSSPKVLHTLETAVFAKSFSNLNVTLLRFPGSGVISELKYLIRNIDRVAGYRSDRVFALLDLDIFIENEDRALRETLRFLTDNFKEKLGPETVSNLKNIGNSKKLTAAVFSNVLHAISNDKGTGITLILDNFCVVFDNPRLGRLLCKVLWQIKKVCPMKISFIFNNTHELDSEDSVVLGELLTLFIENFLYGKDVLFDDVSAGLLFENHMRWYRHDYSEKFVAKVIATCYGDPTLVKELSNKARANRKFEDMFVASKSVEDAATLLGTEFLNFRYKRILKELLVPSLQFLLGKSEEPSDYLTKTGLVVRGVPGKGWRLLNPLFDHFVKVNAAVLEEFIKEKSNYPTSADDTLKESLSGQEYLLHNFLHKNPGCVVMRDEVAQAIWGAAWEQSYSDQAIDKLVSTLRAKLKAAGAVETIKVLKGKGFIYE